MAALNVLVNQNSRDDGTPITQATQREVRSSSHISAFGEERSARQFLQNNREKLHQLGYSEDAEIRTLYNTTTGEAIGAYLRSKPKMTDEDASSALDDMVN